MRGTQHKYRARGAEQQDSRLLCSLPSSSILYLVAYSLPPDKMLPSLPVKNSVLRQLGITNDELPQGLRRLKDNLLIPPSHTPSQESNICANSGFNVHVNLSTSPSNNYSSYWFGKWLELTIAKSPSHPYPVETFRSLNYLDQIALACLATGCHDCQVPDCLQYRRKLESIVPVCRSWPGLRDWVLCITSCSLRRVRDTDLRSLGLGDEKSKNGLSGDWNRWDKDLLPRFRTFIAAFIVLTHKNQIHGNWDIAGRVLGADHLVGTDESGVSGSIGQPLQKVEVSSRHCHRITPEVLTCHRNLFFTIDQGLGPAFITKHLILYKREPTPRVHQ